MEKVQNKKNVKHFLLGV